MHNAIATVSLRGTLEEKLAAAAQAGFQSVEIFENDLIGSALRPQQVRRLMEDAGLSCSLYQPFRDFEGMPGDLRQRALDRAERKFDVMEALGTDRILVCSNCSPASLGDRQRIVDDFRDLGERAAKRGIRVGYEALAWGRHVNDHRDVWSIVKAVDHPAIGIILDSFHSLSRGIPSESIREIAGDKIVYVQLADAPLLDMDLLYWSRHFRNLPGQGGFDLARYVAEILRTGYDGPLSLEIFNDRFRSISTKLIAEDGHRSLEYVRDAALRVLGEPTAMPAPQAPLRAEFVEFTAGTNDVARLGDTLETLGFARTATHRTKKVTRWRQGEVNLVVNAEPRGFAQSYRIVHGTSICAIGVRVNDAQAVMDRAAALGIRAYRPEGRPGRMAMPALRGVGGSLVYLVEDAGAEALWAREFEPVENTEVSGDAGVRGIDHLAAVVHNDEFLSWQLYWRALFGLEGRDAQDVIDPAGLVHSQALQSPDGAFRLTLNASDARETLSSRFLAQGLGGGFQHVALTSEDMVATAQALQARGAAMLEVPANYYDDLAARFGLADDVVAAMVEAHMLYDEDFEGNSYRQLYSRAFDKLFFFEFVERAAAYVGYGAANAGVRLAAQNRYRGATVGAE
ncbi:TIM barrel protein [Novosphingobium resinovorum]|uniref:bifunctional sugar phosphate isomerase/epimerase/4-hydroxyphenylpyruvate dioxygenase family protein n=1 Tax=Novosphingobium TaxID=165696 RepID=UPI001B3C5CDB|nr:MULTISPECIES: sugar phosphate isomerase/epimerase and 4-hydroxyphenylpyruvate domain-containing protein [Novosphingobium]MBF7013360.1 sugar phosphate isomerase/epimerase and 4-hydroxyphenylpyruvate domain-containing protein [Novosphingobium sp. HR1a]WJM25511.1 TIM barrel protein [Novosphingobium resinovorum]